MNDINFIKSLNKAEPFLDHKNAVLSAPIRHLFMIGVIWYLNKNKKITNILEIGSWFGASTLSWAQGLLKYAKLNSSITCIDAWEPFFDMNVHADHNYANEMEQLLESEFAYNIFLHNMRTIKKELKTQHFRGKSENILCQLKNEIYDVVFIDADHTYKSVSKDIKNSLRLVKDGGIICGDDLNLQLCEIDKDYANKNKDKDFIKDPLTNKNYHPGVTLAVFEEFGEVSSWGGFWAMQRRNNTWQKFSLKNMDVVYPSHFTKTHLEKAKSHFNDIKDSLY
ncbi:MAG: class I SAM-dependent methyltransferase [Gammaproteobacteria bacterium]|jgi:predicted O-methyltransferase YrrM